MRFAEVFRYEFAHRLRSVSTWVYVPILALVAMLLIVGPGGDGPATINAPLNLAKGAVITATFGFLVSAGIFADAALRDVEAGMDPLLFTTPLTKAQHLGGRFTAAFAANALVFLAIPLGQVLARFVFSDETNWGPLRLAAHLEPFVTLLLPNLALVGAVLFALAIRTRAVIPVYVGAMALLIGYIVAANVRDAMGNPWIAAILDPLALGTLEDHARYWTPVEQDGRRIGLPPMLLANRVAWLGVATLILGALHRWFRFAHHERAAGRRWLRRRDRRDEMAVDADATRPVPVRRLVGDFGAGLAWRQLRAVIRDAWSDVTSARSFAAILAAFMFLTWLFAGEAGASVFDTSAWPVTPVMLETVLNTPLVPLTYLVISLYAGELTWKERDAGSAEIAGAAPVREWVVVTGRFAVLLAVLALTRLAMIAGGVLHQATQGYHDHDGAVYAGTLLGLDLASLVPFAALAFALHALLNHKYVAHLVVLGACIAPTAAYEFGLAGHHLLLFGKAPDWTYSPMNGYGPFLAGAAWFRAYWAAWAALVVVLAALAWIRGRETGLAHRMREARARLGGRVARVAAVLALLVATLGGFAFYNTNVLNEYVPADRAGERMAGYERRYKRFDGAPQPVIAAADLRVDFDPDAPAASLTGRYLLRNDTDATIDSVHVFFMASDVEVRSLALDRGAQAVLQDPDVRYHILALGAPLAPGDTATLAFDIAYRPRGFRNRGAPTRVVRNGSRLDRTALPIIGYQRALELNDAEERRRYALGPRPEVASPRDVVDRRYRHGLTDSDLVRASTTLCTSRDQVAVAPGALRREWEEDGRRCFLHELDPPTAFGGPFVSARFAIAEDRWGDVALQVFHHPAHTENVDRALHCMRASLAYLSREFAPYPYAQLSMVEIPRYGGFGSAHPGFVTFTEDFFFSHVRDGEIDQPFYGMAHEVAHHWWGGMVRGAAGVRGAGLLSESLANYSAMMITEQAFGADVARRVYDFQMERYLRGRAEQSREVPLLEVNGQPYIEYRKGAIALYTLREWIGEEALNAALRRFVATHGTGRPPFPTSHDLYAELRAATPDSLRPMLADWFERVTLWDVRTERAQVTPAPGGGFEVTLDIVARKVTADSAGREAEVPMDEWVEVGAFAAGQEGATGEALKVERRRIVSGRQQVRLLVDRAPVRAGIDPWRRLIERERTDNLAEVRSP